jgi:hypothetical protein
MDFNLTFTALTTTSTTKQDEESVTKVLTKNQFIILVIYMATLSTFGSILNILVMIVYRKKREQYASIYLLFVLASVDLTVSLLVVPFTLLTYFPLFRKAGLLCSFAYFSRYSTASLSVCLLGLVAVERYHTISSRIVTSIHNIQLTFIRNSRISAIIATVICLLYGFGCFFIFENLDDSRGCGEQDPGKSKIYNYAGMFVLMLILVSLIILYIKTYIIVKKSRNKVFFINKNEVVNMTLRKKTARFEPTNDFLKVKVDNNQENCVNTLEATQTDSAGKVVISTIENISSLFRANEAIMNKSNRQTSLTEVESTSATSTRNKLFFNFISKSYLKESLRTNNLPVKVYEYQTESVDQPSNISVQRQIPIVVTASEESKISTFPQQLNLKEEHLRYNKNASLKWSTTMSSTETLSVKLAKFYSKVFTNQNSDHGTNECSAMNVMSIQVAHQHNRSINVNLKSNMKIFVPKRQTNHYNMSIRKDWRLARMFALVSLDIFI